MNVAWVHPDSIADFCPTASNLLKSWQMWDRCNQLQLKCPWFPANVSCPMNLPLSLGCCYYLMRQWNMLKCHNPYSTWFQENIGRVWFWCLKLDHCKKNSIIVARNICLPKNIFFLVAFSRTAFGGTPRTSIMQANCSTSFSPGNNG